MHVDGAFGPLGAGGRWGAARIPVSNGAASEDDVAIIADAMLRVVRGLRPA